MCSIRGMDSDGTSAGAVGELRPPGRGPGGLAATAELRLERSLWFQRSLWLRSISHILALIGGALVFAGCLVVGWQLSASLGLAGAEVQDLRPVDQMRFVGLLAEEYWRTGDVTGVREALAGWDSSERGRQALAELMTVMELKFSADVSADVPSDDPDVPSDSSPQGAQALQHLIALREALELPEIVVTLDFILRQSAVLWSAGLAMLLMFAAAFVAFGPIAWDVVAGDGRVLTGVRGASQIVAGTVAAPGQSDGTSAGTELLSPRTGGPRETAESGPSALEREFADVEQELLGEELAGLGASDGTSGEGEEESEGELTKGELSVEEQEALDKLAAAESAGGGLGGILSDLFEVEEEEQIDLDSLARDLLEIDTAELLEKATHLARTLRELFSADA